MLRTIAFSLVILGLAISPPRADAQQGGGRGFGGGSQFNSGGTSQFGSQSGFGQSGFGQSGFGQSGAIGGGLGQGVGRGQNQFGRQGGNAFVGRSGADTQRFFQQLGQGSNQFFQRLERSFGDGGNRGRNADRAQERRPPVRVQLSLGFQPSVNTTATSSAAVERIEKSLASKGFDAATVSIKNGVAEISGQVADASDSRLIERIVRLEPGIASVDNRLTVNETELILPAPEH